MNAAQSPARRRLLAGLLGAACVPLFARATLAAAAATTAPAIRWLELTSTHTGESIKATYRDANGLVADAIASLQHVLRDHRTGEAHAMDAGLYDQLADLAAAADAEPRYEIISGYRSPATNAALRDKSTGVSSKSLHMEGRAMDVRLRGVSIERLNELALALARGGVGYYPGSRFVHIDTGRVRRWQG
ncbi:MAG: DUF882 domain-containing protein [Pseudomonadota bacterium]